MTCITIIIGIVFIYALGRSHGSDKAKRTLRGFFSDDKRRK